MRSYSSEDHSCHAICQWIICVYVHGLLFLSECLGVKAPISESPRQTPARISVLHLKSPKPKPFSGKGENPVPMRTFPEVYLLFPERWLGGALGNQSGGFQSCFRLWTQSFCSFEHKCLETSEELARVPSPGLWSRAAVSFDECGLEPALGIIKAFLFLNEGQLAP